MKFLLCGAIALVAFASAANATRVHDAVCGVVHISTSTESSSYVIPMAHGEASHFVSDGKIVSGVSEQIQEHLHLKDGTYYARLRAFGSGNKDNGCSCSTADLRSYSEAHPAPGCEPKGKNVVFSAGPSKFVVAKDKKEKVRVAVKDGAGKAVDVEGAAASQAVNKGSLPSDAVFPALEIDASSGALTVSYPKLPEVQAPAFGKSEELLAALEKQLKVQDALFDKFNATLITDKKKVVSDYQISTVATKANAAYKTTDILGVVTLLNDVIDRQFKISNATRNINDAMAAYATDHVDEHSTYVNEDMMKTPFGIAMVVMVGLVALIVVANMIAICRTDNNGFSKLLNM